MKPSHLTTPRQMADCTFVQGHGAEQIKPSREWAMYAAFLGGVFFTLFGWHAIAVIWG
jgi:hypothetical protein